MEGKQLPHKAIQEKQLTVGLLALNLAKLELQWKHRSNESKKTQDKSWTDEKSRPDQAIAQRKTGVSNETRK